MKLIIENTTKIVGLQASGGAGAIPARIWEGITDTGIKVHLYVTRIAVAMEENQEEFERELRSVREPSPAVEAIPMRLIL